MMPPCSCRNVLNLHVFGEGQRFGSVKTGEDRLHRLPPFAGALPDTAAGRGRPRQRGFCKPAAQGCWQVIEGAHRIASGAATRETGFAEVSAHATSSGSSKGSRTRTSRVSPVPSMGGDRCNSPDRGVSGQSVPRRTMGDPVGTVNTRRGSPPPVETPYRVPVPRYVQTSRAVTASIWNRRQAFLVTTSSRNPPSLAIVKDAVEQS